jgi:hypothetical protein
LLIIAATFPLFYVLKPSRQGTAGVNNSHGDRRSGNRNVSFQYLIAEARLETRRVLRPQYMRPKLIPRRMRNKFTVGGGKLS